MTTYLLPSIVFLHLVISMYFLQLLFVYQGEKGNTGYPGVKGSKGDLGERGSNGRLLSGI